MKESGLNYFYQKAEINPSAWEIFYTFENGIGENISSVQNASEIYTGVLSNVGDFWASPGSGFVSGNFINVRNFEEINQQYFTQIFVFEKLTSGRCELFRATEGADYSLGITDANKLYFDNGFGITAPCQSQLGQKSAVVLRYLPNNIAISYYNPTTSKVETTNTIANFNLANANAATLFSGFTGFVDYYLYISDFIYDNSLESLLSGLFYRKTGEFLPVETICESVITGYQSVEVIKTGITGYKTTVNGSGGIGYFSGEFPGSEVVGLTGIISRAVVSSGVVGQICYDVTGDLIDSLEWLSGYCASFGMDGYTFLTNPSGLHLFALNVTPQQNKYNFSLQSTVDGFVSAEALESGLMNIYLNGLATTSSGYNFAPSFLSFSGADQFDNLTYDLESGTRSVYENTGIIPIQYVGQSIFLNGVALASGLDFTASESGIELSLENKDISGVVFEYPFAISFASGAENYLITGKFSKNGSVIYVNGIRQKLGVDYVEKSKVDGLGKNLYNSFDNIVIYDGNGLFWE